MAELTLDEEEQVEFLKWLGRYEYSFGPSDYEEVVKDYSGYKRKKKDDSKM